MSSPSLSGIKAPPTPSTGVEEAQGRGATPGQAFQIPRPECFPCEGMWGCGGIDYKIEDVDSVLKEKEKIILLNAIVAPPEKDSPWFMIYKKIPAEVAIYMLSKARVVESYVGHEATAQVLTQLSGRTITASRAMYTPRYDDLTLVVRLKKRLERPEDVKNISLQDLEFAILWYW
ncbi:MAG: STIV orfB116 family protein [Infirmifilum uzonense]|uniref:STIV orfB116 family protein n=1 Tax=Infirmifilum uzonense TaxID=1550241 RepID=UPI003C74AA08